MGTRTASRKLVLLILLYLLALWLATTALHAEGDPIHITRAAGPITVDGDLSDPGWKGAVRLETWYETNPGDNVPPKVKNVGYLTYDDRFLYAAFEFSDPDPSKIRAPYADRDNIGGSLDYGGIIVNPRNDGRTGLLLLANPRGVQYDAVSDDFSGEDSSPDFYWDSAAKITKDGWVLEMRVPFSSLRYPKGDPQTWAIMLYRNYPRQFRYQFFTSKLPRGSSCFICHCDAPDRAREASVRRPPRRRAVRDPQGGGCPAGRSRLAAREQAGPRRRRRGREVDPQREHGHRRDDQPRLLAGRIGRRADRRQRAVRALLSGEAAVLPGGDRALLDADPGRLHAQHHVAAVGRARDGEVRRHGYTVLVAEDRGGGSVILPGPNGSYFADQDFQSFVGIGRARQNIGKSFVSFLATDREVRGGGYNRVYGPDFQWRPNDHETVTGQFLLSNTKTPDRPDLAPEWDGPEDELARRRRLVPAQRPALGLVHRVPGLRRRVPRRRRVRAAGGVPAQLRRGGRTFRPTGLFNRFRRFLQAEYSADTDHNLIFREISPGVGMDGRMNSFARVRLAFDKVKSGGKNLSNTLLVYTFQISPSGVFSNIVLDGDRRRGGRLRELARRARREHRPRGDRPPLGPPGARR